MAMLYNKDLLMIFEKSYGKVNYEVILPNLKNLLVKNFSNHFQVEHQNFPFPILSKNPIYPRKKNDLKNNVFYVLR